VLSRSAPSWMPTMAISVLVEQVPLGHTMSMRSG
jgi:hypothetical protein